MVEDVRLAANGKCPVNLYSRVGGVLPTVAEIADHIRRICLDNVGETAPVERISADTVVTS